jgi:hypothetical protein
VFRFLDGPTDRPIAFDLLCTPTHRPGHTGPGVAHLLRRLDYGPTIACTGRIAHYSDEHRNFDGIMMPTRRTPSRRRSG